MFTNILVLVMRSVLIPVIVFLCSGCSNDDSAQGDTVGVPNDAKLQRGEHDENEGPGSGDQDNLISEVPEDRIIKDASNKGEKKGGKKGKDGPRSGPSGHAGGLRPDPAQPGPRPDTTPPQSGSSGPAELPQPPRPQSPRPQSPRYVPSPLDRNGRIHFVMNQAQLANRGIVGFRNGLALCFIVSGIQLLLHAAPFRDFLADLANREPAVTGVPRLTEDIVRLFNTVWGDGVPNPPPAAGEEFPVLNIGHRLYATLVAGGFGVQRRVAGVIGDFFPRFLNRIINEIDHFEPNGMSALFTFTIHRTAPHQPGAPGAHVGEPEENLTDRILRITTGMGPPYTPIETSISMRLRGDDAWETFLSCNVCGHRVIQDQIVSQWIVLPRILTFSVDAQEGISVVDPATILTFVDGVVIPRDDPRAVAGTAVANRVQYDLIGYLVHDGGHYKAVVKHFETDQWYEINDDRILRISGSDPRQNNIMGNGYSIQLVMYTKRPRV